jgi:hypothetical protein
MFVNQVLVPDKSTQRQLNRRRITVEIVYVIINERKGESMLRVLQLKWIHKLNPERHSGAQFRSFSRSLISQENFFFSFLSEMEEIRFH